MEMLRSLEEVKGYHIQATDGKIGHVEDFIVDDESWEIRYLVVDTRKWLHGKQVLLSPKWIQEIKWLESNVYVDLSREAVRNSPKYDPFSPVNREYEIRLYDYYGRPKYWM
jgi:sporulation protein YlmC with PRC-barrel domain